MDNHEPTNKEILNSVDNLGKTVDDVLTAVNGFSTDVDKRFNGMEGRFEKRFDVIEKGQEEIKLKLDNVAYRFELVELQKRVEVLEEKLGVAD